MKTINTLIIIAVISIQNGIILRSIKSQGADSLSHISTSPQIQPPILSNVSAYCPCSKCCGQYADGITASGHVIKKGDRFVAAPKEIPFGTIIDIPGYGSVPVLDRGGAIKGNKLDVYFDTHEEALQWGRQYLNVKYL